MAGISEYERLQIESLLNRKNDSIEQGIGLALLPSDPNSYTVFESAIRPAMAKNDLSTVEVRQVFNSDSTLNDVCHWVMRAEVIIADVSSTGSHLMYVL